MASNTISNTRRAQTPSARNRRRRLAIIKALGRIVTKPSGLVGAILLTLVIFVAVFAPLIAPFDPLEQNWGDELLAPGAPYYLGTDDFGRDILSRVIFGARISLFVAGTAVGLGAFFGTSMGLIAGYYGGWVDAVLMRLSDMILAYPSILIAIGIIVVLEPGIVNVVYALAIVNTPRFARIMRASVLVQREQEYVKSARCIGCSDTQIILKHILPNSLGPVTVEFGLAMAFAVILEASLSFLGLGAQPPTPSWGSILSDGKSFIRFAWWYGVFPGVALSLMLFGVNSFTDALTDVLDPERKTTS